MQAADTCFMIISASFVMLMTPALALFYGGLSRAKNILATSMYSYASLGFVTILWALFGYSLAFGGDVKGIIGDLSYLFLANVEGCAAPQQEAIPHSVFMAFQCMFAVLTVALVSGSYAGRIRFKAMCLFSALWLFVCYCPLAHWVWGGGWMQTMGALDFAGGAVVHMSSGAAALACAQVLGPRQKIGTFAPNNLPLSILGLGLLWFGWFGFNAGSALLSGNLAGHAFLTTHLATGAGIVGWMAIECWKTGKPTSLGAISGALSGLVAITPGAGFVSLVSAIPIGFFAGMFCYGCVFLKKRFHYDDALDVVGIHGMGGAFGALATGLFASASVNGVNGLFYGNPKQFLIQLVSVVATWGYVYIASRLLLRLTDSIVPLRVEAEAEAMGLDVSEHNERAYSIR